MTDGSTGSAFGDLEVTVASLATYRNDVRYPFCPGCGHGGILDALDAALVRLQLDPQQTVIVSDMGCAGLSDQFFRLGAFHGLRGRSLTYAAGIKLARPELKVVVTLGDGALGIAGAHLLAAARRNLGLTVLVFDNQSLGVTGGRHGATTTPRGTTAATPAGDLQRPLDVCATVAVNGAAYAWRGTVFDEDLPERIAEAVSLEGFALLDIWEICTADSEPADSLSREALGDTMKRLGLKTGLLHRTDRPEYSTALRQVARAAPAPPAPRTLEPRFSSRLSQPFGIVLAGSAGGRVCSAARLAADAAALSGLYAAQRDDHSFIVKTGHSLSELVFSPRALDWSGLTRPDAVVVGTQDGLRAARRSLAALAPHSRVYSAPGLELPPTPAERFSLDLAAGAVSEDTSALAWLSAALLHTAVLAREALDAAAGLADPERGPENLRAIAAGAELARGLSRAG